MIGQAVAPEHKILPGTCTLPGTKADTSVHDGAQISEAAVRAVTCSCLNSCSFVGACRTVCYVSIFLCDPEQWKGRTTFEHMDAHLAGGLGPGGGLQAGHHVRQEVEHLAQVRRVVARLQAPRHVALRPTTQGIPNAAETADSGWGLWPKDTAAEDGGSFTAKTRHCCVDARNKRMAPLLPALQALKRSSHVQRQSDAASSGSSTLRMLQPLAPSTHADAGTAVRSC